VDEVIVVENLTKDYGHAAGVFDISLAVKRGEVFGFVGPNGAGKTTTMRHLLGFIKADGGRCNILGLDCWEKPQEIQKHIGCVAGEIALPDAANAQKLIDQIAKMRKVETKRAKELCEYFDIDLNQRIKRMSKGMKQKIALALAFMHSPEILLLDEPTSGLDPLMQEKFCDLVLQEKKRGVTILLSSHIFPEVEKTCDRVMIIKQGKIITEIDLKDIEKTKPEYVVTRFSLEKYFMDYYKKVGAK
jgi:ABC-2 type transport system ATP-binding protein